MRQIELFNRFKVGFNYRTDTYTEKLGFVNPLMQEANGKKKEKFKYVKSYDKWRDKKIDEEFYDNEPLSGFVVNYRVGGHYSYWGDIGREPKVRILDPRGFEIEITLENLIEILEFGVSSGKLIEGEYQYVFRDKHLTLIHTKSELYKEIFGNKSEVKEFDKNDELIFGHIYQTSDLGSEVGKHIYIGKQYIYNKGKYKNGYGKVELVDTFIKYIDSDSKSYNNSYDYHQTNVKKSQIKYHLGKCIYDINLKAFYDSMYSCGFNSEVSIEHNWEGYNTPTKKYRIFDLGKFETYTNTKTNFMVNYTTEESKSETDIILDLSNVNKLVKRFYVSGYYSQVFIYNDIAYFIKWNDYHTLNITENGDRFIISDSKGKTYEVSEIITLKDNDPFRFNILIDFIKNGGEVKKMKFKLDEHGVMCLVYDGNVTIDEVTQNQWYSVTYVGNEYISNLPNNPLYETYLKNQPKN